MIFQMNFESDIIQLNTVDFIIFNIYVRIL